MEQSLKTSETQEQQERKKLGLFVETQSLMDFDVYERDPQKS